MVLPQNTDSHPCTRPAPSWCSTLSKMFKVSISKMLRYVKWDVLNTFCFCIFDKYFYITKRSVKYHIWWKLGKFEKVQRDLGICPQPLISHFRQIINHKYKNTINNSKQSQATRNLFAVFFHYRPRFGALRVNILSDMLVGFFWTSGFCFCWWGMKTRRKSLEGCWRCLHKRKVMEVWDRG